MLQGATNAFTNLGGAVVELTTLLVSGDNFPMIMWKSSTCMAITCGRYSAIFYVSLILVGTITVMSVLTAVIFDVYKRQHALLVLQDQVTI